MVRHFGSISSLQPKLAAPKAFKAAANPSARARNRQLLNDHTCGSPGHKYIVHGILRIISGSASPSPLSDMEF